MEIINSKDSLICKHSIDAKIGFNQFRWGLITQKVKSNSPYFIHYNQFIKPCPYKVQLKTSIGVLEKELTVKPYNK